MGDLIGDLNYSYVINIAGLSCIRSEINHFPVNSYEIDFINPLPSIQLCNYLLAKGR